MLLGASASIAGCSSDTDGDATKETPSPTPTASSPVPAPDPSGTEPVVPEPTAPSPDASNGPGVAPSSTEPAVGPSTPLEYNRCAADVSVGDLALVLAAEYTAFTGRIADGVVPAAVPELIATDGDCRLLTTPNLTCDGCNVVSETCSPTGCIPYPQSIDAGTVTVDGLLAELMMTPSGGSKSYSNPTGFPHPGFDTGAEITLSTSGSDALAAFSLRGWGVPKLETAQTPVMVSAGKAAVIDWTPPATDGPAKIYLTLNINHHGSTSEWITCETADTGHLEISATLIDQLVARGFSGWPTIEMRRQTADSTTTDVGCINFYVQSPVVLDVEVEGLVSCGDDSECPDGQTCRQDQSCG